MRSDQQLLARYTHSQDREALGQLFGRHYPAVYQVVRRMARDEFEARDVTQMVFLSAMSSAESCREPDRFRHWLLKIAVNEMRQQRRRKQPEFGPDDLFDMFAELQSGTVEQSAIRVEFERALESNLDKMPPKLREPLVLHYYESLSLGEISSILSVAKSTVQNRLDKAIRLLRTRFDQQGGSRLVALLPQFLPALVAPGDIAALTVTAAGGGGMSVAIGVWFMSHSKLVGAVAVLLALMVPILWDVLMPGASGTPPRTDTVQKTAAKIEGGSNGTSGTSAAGNENRMLVTGGSVGESKTRARVIDASDGLAISKFWVMPLQKRRTGSGYLLPRFNHCGSWLDMRDAILPQPGTIEVENRDGEFNFELSKSAGALAILAPDHAMLIAVSEDFGAVMPVFQLERTQHRTLVVLDHQSESPIADATLLHMGDRNFDFISRLRSELGNSPIKLQSTTQTKLQSDASGTVTLPLRVSFAVYTGQPTARLTERHVPGPFTVHREGYSYSVVSRTLLASKEPHSVYLSPATTSLKVTILDASGSPMPAGLIFESQEREDAEVGCFTDARGQCIVQGLPAGKMQITIGKALRGHPTSRPGQLLSGSSVSQRIEDRVTRVIQIKAGNDTEFRYQVGIDDDAVPEVYAYLICQITGLDADTRLGLTFQTPNGASGRGGISGPSYKRPLAINVPVEVLANWSVDGLSVVQSFKVPALGANEEYRLNLQRPSTDHLVRIHGNIRLSSPDIWLPDSITLIRVGKKQLRMTPKVPLLASAVKPAAGSPFSIRLAPGRYRVIGEYLTGPSNWNWFDLRHVEVTRDSEMDLELPAVSEVRVQPQDSEGKSLRFRNDDAFWCMRSLGSQGNWESDVLWTPGDYELLFMAKGYLPHRSRVTIGNAASHVLTPTVRPGSGASISGLIVEGKTKQTLASKFEVICHLEGVDEVMRIQASMGRFEISGLAAGDYSLTVRHTGTDETAEAHHFHVEIGEQLKGVRLVFPR